MVRRQVGVAALCALLFSSGGGAASALPRQAVPAAKLLQKEEQARGKAAAEMASLARFAASLNAIDDARAAYSTALVLAPRDEKVKGEVEKLRKKKNKPQKEGLAQIAERRTKALAKAVELLLPVVDSYAEADRSDDLARIVSLMRTQAMPVEAPLAKYELVFYEPYLDWRQKKDVERLQAGGEMVDGAWCDAQKVASLDAAHSDWSNPWRISDDVHEVRTTLPLRTARRILASVGSFRHFLLGYLAGEMDLRAPPPKLPVILTATRAEMDQRVLEFAKGERAPPGAAAFYLSGNRVGNPCFVSFEFKDATGKVLKVDVAGLRAALLHEVTHQILFEYSKHAADNSRPTQFDPWVVEGIAEFLPSYVLVDGVWVLKHLRGVPAGAGSLIEGGFGWCHDHADQLTPLREFVAISQAQMANVQNYHLACGLAAFLLEGKDRSYRSQFCDLAELVHQARENEESFATCFKGVDVQALDAEFRAFCREIKLDGK